MDPMDPSKKMPPMGGPPPAGGEPPMEEMSKQIGDVVSAADKAGALDPLKAFIADQALDITPDDLLKYAQDIPELHGKKPAELVQMLTDDDSLVDDIMRARDQDQRKGDAEAPPESFEAVMKRMRTGGKKPGDNEEAAEEGGEDD
jgi:hypothetical protein